MRFSEAWLRSWVNPELSTEQLGERLTMAGLELDKIEPAALTFQDVVVAEVKQVSPHPNADRLRVCEVDAGGDELLQIVCGAPNVEAGMRAPLAQIGAKLPDGTVLKPARLRGVQSSGMLCSAKELGLAESAQGLMALPGDAPVGISVRDYLDLDDCIFEVDLTPNRADCLSIKGIAREVATLTGADLQSLQMEPVPACCDEVFGLDIQLPEACPHYAGRVIKGIDPGASTPVWMQERLRRSGLRSLGPVVDVTNYVMLELGQPMHAFDVNRLHGGVQVRLARDGESLTLLDGQTVKLDPDVLVIADVEGPLALAGIMGGLGSGVTGETRDIFLESAFFTPQAIAGKARRYGMHTDSSHRFERGVDPRLQVLAIERATALLLEIVGGIPGPVIESVAEDSLPSVSPITLRHGRVGRLLGISLSADEIERILLGLGCEVLACAEGWHVVPPSFRFDLTVEADLIEEIGRVYGYDRIPVTHPGYRLQIQSMPESKIPLSRIRNRLVDLGYQEAITFSFVNPGLEQLLNPHQVPKGLANPLSRDMAVMRTSLWSGLIPALQHNLNRQQSRVRLFEAGLRFPQEGTELRQLSTLAGVLAGTAWPEQWGQSTREIDFFDLKGDVETLLHLLARGKEITFEREEHPALHPGQSAAIYLAAKRIGYLGALHPEIEAQLGLGQHAYLFEMDLEVFDHAVVPEFEPLSRFPAIRRDIAVIVDHAVTAQQVLGSLADKRVAELREVRIFDLYSGKGVTEGRKSIALGLILQDLSRTLTDQEVEGIVSDLVAKLGRDFGATLRE